MKSKRLPLNSWNSNEKESGSSFWWHMYGQSRKRNIQTKYQKTNLLEKIHQWRHIYLKHKPSPSSPLERQTVFTQRSEFTAKLSETETTFLDTKVCIGGIFNKESILDVRTDFKAIKTFQYTNFYSCHPPGVTKGFIKGETLTPMHWEQISLNLLLRKTWVISKHACRIEITQLDL